ncbi:MAG: hypothetical protein KDA20_05580 [Phycisphaerales bacterium]|nr:hypothetical protein [Phycisphaerales bacterium]
MGRRFVCGVGAASALCVLLCVPSGTRAQSAEEGRLEAAPEARMGQYFTYQGRLRSGGLPANGVFNMTFRLFNVPVGGTPMISLQGFVQVTNGVFTEALPTSVALFDGGERWLEIEVDGNILTPRQQVAPTPYALRADAIELPYQGTYAGTGHGLSVLATNPSATASVHGRTGSTNFLSNGILGEATSDAGGGSVGVRGSNLGTSNFGIGVWGSHAGNGFGVHSTTSGGTAFNASNASGAGALFNGSQPGTNISIGRGNKGIDITESESGSGDAYAIVARQSAVGQNDTPAIFGVNDDADYYGIGVSGKGGYRGVEGLCYGTGTNTYYGVYGVASSGGSGFAASVYGVDGGGTGTRYAGYFAGNAHVTGTLSKGAGSFKIDHPLDPYNKFLYHSFVESPEMMNIYNGNAVLDASGRAVVQMPDYFQALNRDFRYQLTPIGAAMPNLFVASEIRDGVFEIAGGVPGAKVSWMVTGVRQDAFANEHRIPVEEWKQGREVGKLLHPAAFGRAAEEGIDRSRELEEAAKSNH